MIIEDDVLIGIRVYDHLDFIEVRVFSVESDTDKADHRNKFFELKHLALGSEVLLADRGLTGRAHLSKDHGFREFAFLFSFLLALLNSFFLLLYTCLGFLLALFS